MNIHKNARLTPRGREGLELCEGVFDRIEVGTIGRQVAKFGARSLDHLAHARSFMAGEVRHDDVAGAQFGHEHFGDIGLQGVAVDRPVENPRRDEASQCERPDEGCRFPVAVRNASPEPFAARAASMTTRHVSGGPGLVDKHEACRIEIDLPSNQSSRRFRMSERPCSLACADFF